MKNINPLNPRKDNQDLGRNAALDLIKERIREIYGDDPSQAESSPQIRLVDRFWKEHSDSSNPQAAWQTFYNGLNADEKQSLWNDYHSVSGADSRAPNAPTQQTQTPAQDPQPDQQATVKPQNPLMQDQTAPKKTPSPESHAVHIQPTGSKKESIQDTKEKLIAKFKATPRAKKKVALNAKRSKKGHWVPLMLSLSAMMLVVLAQYNPLLFALAKQYISPGDTLNSPVIVDPSVNIEISDESRIIIPKINVDVPVVYDVGTKEETAIQAALERGVVHYDGTSQPGEPGNNVIVGHSSNNFLNSGKYKFAFVLLDRLEIGETFILHHEGIRYVYRINNKQVIEPTDFSLVQPTAKPTVTLITCTPPGTSWKRLVVQAEQISPTLTQEQTNTPASTEPITQAEDEIVPGNAPSFFQRATDWIF